MSKKVGNILIVVMLVITLLLPVGLSNLQPIVEKQAPTERRETLAVLSFQQPQLTENQGFVEIQVEGATTELLEPQKPVLPIHVQTYQIPFRSTNIQVTCTPKDIGTMTVPKDVIPARAITTSGISAQNGYEKDLLVYESTAFYPDTWYSYELGAGRNENDHQVTFVKIICYPVRYTPANNQIQYADSFDITLSYNAPDAPLNAPSESYNMVVIAPSSFESTLKPLIDFKNSKGLTTTFKSMESILTEYQGYDQPEQVKKFIKYAYDTWGITYVLLVGGLKNHLYAKDKDTASAGWKAWWVPVRYVNIPHVDDEGCLCDLYYGCLYNATGGFDSWDSNGDGVYAAWGAVGPKKDTFDMNPEVYVGRLPAANKRELKRVVDKIIAYEGTGPSAKSWYTTFVGIGGKTGDYYQGKPDGEYLCDLAYNYTKLAIPTLKQTQVYTTNRNSSRPVPDTKGIVGAYNQGAGFIDMQGHGSPAKWDTIWFDGVYPVDWVGGLPIQKFWKLRNGEKLPVVVVGGCHNAMYNISIIPAMKDTEGTTYFVYGYPIPMCFCWGLLVRPTGGAIASTGSTGYGVGYGGKPISLSAELELNFFIEIGNGDTHVSQAQNHAIQKFLAEEEIGQTEAFVITDWALIGDPSLLFGGYSS